MFVNFVVKFIKLIGNFKKMACCVLLFGFYTNVNAEISNSEIQKSQIKKTKLQTSKISDEEKRIQENEEFFNKIKNRTGLKLFKESHEFFENGDLDRALTRALLIPPTETIVLFQGEGRVTYNYIHQKNWILIQIAFAYLEKGNEIKAFEILQKNVDLFRWEDLDEETKKELKDPEIFFQAYKLCAQLRKTELALAMLDHALENSKQTDNYIYQKNWILIQIAFAYLEKGNEIKAFEILQKNVDLFRWEDLDEETKKELKDPEIFFQAYKLCAQLRKTELALAMLDHALENSKQTEKVELLTEIAEIYIDLQNSAVALDLLQQAKAQIQLADDSWDQKQAFLKIFLVYIKARERELAIDALIEAFMKDFVFKSENGEKCLLRLKTYLIEKKLEGVIDYLKRVIKFVEESEGREPVKKVIIKGYQRILKYCQMLKVLEDSQNS